MSYNECVECNLLPSSVLGMSPCGVAGAGNYLTSLVTTKSMAETGMTITSRCQSRDIMACVSSSCQLLSSGEHAGNAGGMETAALPL